MLERFHPLLRIVCLLLAGLVLYQISGIVARKDSLANLGVESTFSTLNSPEAPAANPGTNAVRGTNAAPGREPVKKQTEVPPAVQARVDRITQSEILGPVIRPLPMALIGIAGKDVLLRTANGQTGLLREGEELGGVKLLRIGTNRVLIEHEQQQKELTVFSGVGGETLLPKGENKPQ
jgi:hypothetical protein